VSTVVKPATYSTPEEARDALLKRRRKQTRRAVRNRMRYTETVLDLTVEGAENSAAAGYYSSSDDSYDPEAVEEPIYIGTLPHLLNIPYYYGGGILEEPAAAPTDGYDAEEYLVE
jgi:hypothetical protein